MQKEKHITLDDYINYAYISDLEVSSMLVSLGYELASTDNPKPNKITFIFRRSSSLEKVVDDFLSGKLNVNALAFSNARKNLKSRIYAQKIIDY